MYHPKHHLTSAKRPLSSSETSDDGPVPKRSNVSNVSDARLQKMDELKEIIDKIHFRQARETAVSVSSPGKRIGLRTQCIDQLTKWHKLKEDGVISDAEYQEMHKTIMGDIKTF